jgi:glucokinase-like ROK family protein
LRLVVSPRLGSLESLRELNRLRVIDTLLERGLASRAEIARRTGLSRTTVSSLVADLVERGLVSERGDVEHPGAQGGRPGVLLALNPSAGVAIGIDFGHSHLRVAVSDLAHTVLAEAEQEMDVDASASDGLAAATALVERVLAEADVERDRVLGVGMGLPGPIDDRTGMVGSTAILPGWVGVSAAEEMEDRLGLPVHVDNDANLGARAEALYGAGRDTSDMVYLKVASGIGAGILIGGRIHRGHAGTAGEIGHSLIAPDGHVCRCGNRGCLETLAATPGLLEQLRRTHGGGLTIHDVIALARDGDPVCARVISDAGHWIGLTLAGLCNLLNPARIVVGGELSAAGELLIDPLRASLQGHVIPAAGENVEVVTGELGERAEVLGALALAIGQSDRVLSSRLVEAAAHA